MKQEELIKLIDKKIKELEEKEQPNELLIQALIKKGILSKNDKIDNSKIEKIFEIIKKEIWSTITLYIVLLTLFY